MTDGDTALPPPPTPPTAAVTVVRRTPRVGEMTSGWRVVTACAWVGVVAAFAAIWNTSERLGLSTWWLGPRGDPNPIFIQLSPFVVPGLMLVATANNVRRLAVLGIAASVLMSVFGFGDLARVPGLAALELGVAAAALAVSIASLTGTYRLDPNAAAPPSS